jgi:hypothetical protein
MYGECVALSFCGACHVSHERSFMQKSVIADYPPQIRDVTGGGGMEWWFIRGAVCRFSPKQESWLNWRSIEVVK